jgi:hypothetical protein
MAKGEGKRLADRDFFEGILWVLRSERSLETTCEGIPFFYDLLAAVVRLGRSRYLAISGFITCFTAQEGDWWSWARRAKQLYPWILRCSATQIHGHQAPLTPKWSYETASRSLARFFRLIG